MGAPRRGSPTISLVMLSRDSASARGPTVRPPGTRRKSHMSASSPTAAKASGRPPTDPAGPTGRLATWVAETTLDDVPASVRDRAKHLVLDGIGCALIGAQLPSPALASTP